MLVQRPQHGACVTRPDAAIICGKPRSGFAEVGRRVGAPHQKDADFGVVREVLDSLFPALGVHAAIEAAVLQAQPVDGVLSKVQHRCPLGEHQDLLLICRAKKQSFMDPSLSPCLLCSKCPLPLLQYCQDCWTLSCHGKMDFIESQFHLLHRHTCAQCS